MKNPPQMGGGRFPHLLDMRTAALVADDIPDDLLQMAAKSSAAGTAANPSGGSVSEHSEDTEKITEEEGMLDGTEPMEKLMGGGEDLDGGNVSVDIGEGDGEAGKDRALDP